MTLPLRLDLDALVSTFTRAVHAPAAFPTPEHAGLSAVLAHLSDEARHAIAHTPERYDHRSLYEFAAALDYAGPKSPIAPSTEEADELEGAQ